MEQRNFSKLKRHVYLQAADNLGMTDAPRMRDLRRDEGLSYAMNCEAAVIVDGLARRTEGKTKKRLKGMRRSMDKKSDNGRLYTAWY